MATPAELVSASFSQAQSYATNAQGQLSAYTAALSAAVQVAPTIEVSFTPVGAPSTGDAPERPGALEEIEAELTYDASGAIAAAMPGALSVSAPSLDIDDFTEEAPTVDFGEAPTLTFGDAPTVTVGTAPTVPEVAEIEVPEAPTVTLPDTPSYLALSTPTFAGVDLRADYLAQLEDIEELSLVAPTPYTYTPNPEYTSALLTELQGLLAARLAGGTGLDADVETALWDRARDRETALAQANIDQVNRDSEALGFHLPAGVTNDGIRRETRAYYDKLSTLSREISIEQAKLEQTNLQHTIDRAVQLEGQLIDYSYKIEALAFESAKAVAQNAIQVHNANVEAYKALLGRYELIANSYKTIIDGELAKVEVYRAQIAGEQAKADTNRTLVMQYEAGVRASMSIVEIYKAEMEGAKIRVEIEGAKVAAAGEQVKAYVAGINGQTAAVEAYKVSVQAQGAKAEAYKAGVDAKLATVQVYDVKARAFAAKAGAQAEEARAQVSYYEGLVRAKTAEWDGWRARVMSEAERIKAVGMKSQSALDGYRADIERYRAEAESDASLWNASIKQYEAQVNYTLNAQKINTEIIHANNTALLEASKVGAQVYAQLTASAYSLINASASVSASAQNSVGYNYSNDTSTQPGAVTSV